MLTFKTLAKSLSLGNLLFPVCPFYATTWSQYPTCIKTSERVLLYREDDSSLTPDACRIHGHLYVNKVAGNFHITVGKYVLFTS